MFVEGRRKVAPEAVLSCIYLAQRWLREPEVVASLRVKILLGLVKVEGPPMPSRANRLDGLSFLRMFAPEGGTGQRGQLCGRAGPFATSTPAKFRPHSSSVDLMCLLPCEVSPISKRTTPRHCDVSRVGMGKSVSRRLDFEGFFANQVAAF